MNRRQLKAANGLAAIGPYSLGYQIGSMTFVSGQVGIQADTAELVSDEVGPQAVKAIENIENILKDAGLGLDSVVKTTVFLTDLDDFNRVNQIYAIYFSHPYPARSCVEVSKLPKGAKVEIECIAIAKDKSGSAPADSDSECEDRWCID